MMEGIQLEQGDYGLRAVVTAAWSEEMHRVVMDSGIVELELNDGKGWRGPDLAFLAAFPHLKSFKIVDLKISSVEQIHFLHELQELKLVTYCDTEVKFSAFPQLENCSLEWRPKATALFDCVTLRKLFVNNYRGSNVDAFARLTVLESLGFLNAPV